MTISEAVLELRHATKLSQQFFATELRMSTKTLQIYESGARDPAPRQLLQFMARAAALEDEELAHQLWDIFHRAFIKALGPLPTGIVLGVSHRNFGSVETYSGWNPMKKGPSR